MTTTLVRLGLAAAAASVAFAAPRPASPEEGSMHDLGGALVAGLHESPGCLGVETANTQSGKTVIFAWFEDKEATIDWYYSGTHQQAIENFVTDDSEEHVPLEHVDDEAGPILCVASLTPNTGKSLGPIQLPISQISIELYEPLPGGLSLNGTFAPEGVEIPHHQLVKYPMGGGSPK